MSKVVVYVDQDDPSDLDIKIHTHFFGCLAKVLSKINTKNDPINLVVSLDSELDMCAMEYTRKGKSLYVNYMKDSLNLSSTNFKEELEVLGWKLLLVKSQSDTEITMLVWKIQQ